MNIFSVPVYHLSNQYFFEPITGLLLVKATKFNNLNQSVVPEKVKRAIHQCNNPYILKKGILKNNKTINRVYIEFYAFTLIKTCKLSFLLGKIVAKFGYPIFDSSQEAIECFRKLYPDIRQNDLCYPRSLFAASTSKKFVKDGVIFIGVFLPSKAMHAWIIEDAIQPDFNDTMWINFQPVAAIY